jgi:hypothetical protein
VKIWDDLAEFTQRSRPEEAVFRQRPDLRHVRPSGELIRECGCRRADVGSDVVGNGGREVLVVPNGGDLFVGADPADLVVGLVHRVLSDRGDRLQVEMNAGTLQLMNDSVRPSTNNIDT